MRRTREITLTVNGAPVEATVPVRRHLIDFLRGQLGLTGSHVGCEHGVCGACTIRVDGVAVRGCLLLAVQADGADVETVEGLSDGGRYADLFDSFVRHNALQCGFCTPGMIASAVEILDGTRALSRSEIRSHLSGNFCRCTGYHAIVDAIAETLSARLERDA